MRKPFVLAVAVLGVSAGMAFGQADYRRYYVGPSQGAWSDPANWATLPGGPSGAGVPVATETGLPFDGANGAVISTTADSAVTFDGDYGTASLVTLDLSASGGSTLTFSQPAGTLAARGTTLDSTNGGSVSYLNTGGRHVAMDPSGMITIGASAGSNASYMLTNTGRVQAGYLFVGKNGTGTFNQLSGSVRTSTDMYVGYAAGSNGYYALGTGNLSADAETIGHEGTGVLRQTGGTNWADYSITVGAKPGSSATYELAGGRVHVDQGPLMVGTTGAFRQSGGTVEASTLQNDGTYDQTGGTVAVPNITGGGSLVANGGRIDAASLRQGSVTLSGNASVAAGFVWAGSMAITGHASLDLGRGMMLLDTAGGSGWVRGSLFGGQLTSSFAEEGLGLGYAVAGDVGMTNLAGEAVTPTSILVSYALVGDANLDGSITNDDYAALEAGFEHGGQWWTQGDFNYDGIVDREDYLLIDRAYLQQCGAVPAGMLESREAAFGAAYVAELGAVVPEPASLGLLVVGAAGLMARRWRTRPGEPAVARGR